jgi:hypothetical protein
MMQWSDIPRDPAPRTLRQFGGLWLLFFGAVAYRCAVRDHNPALAIAFALLATAGGLAALVRPQLLRPIFVGWLMLAFPIGWTVSRCFLAILFYGVLTPLAFAFRWTGRDMLGLRKAAERKSYWEAKPSPTDLASYLRQY